MTMVRQTNGIWRQFRYRLLIAKIFMLDFYVFLGLDSRIWSIALAGIRTRS